MIQLQLQALNPQALLQAKSSNKYTPSLTLSSSLFSCILWILWLCFIFCNISTCLYARSSMHIQQPKLKLKQKDDISTTQETSKRYQLKSTINTLSVKTFGTTISPISTTLTAQTNGILTAILFNAGAHVKQGQRLFELDTDTSGQQLSTLKAQFQLANETYQRLKKLNQLNPKGVSKIDLITAQSDYEAALAIYQKAQDIYNIKAPFSGIVTDTLLAKNDFVTEGTPLIRIIKDNAPVQIRYHLPSQYIHKIALHQPLTFKVDGNTYKANVSYISPNANPDSYDVTLRADLQTARTLPPLRENLFGEITQTLIPETQLIIPQAYVQTDDQGFYTSIWNPQTKKSHKQYFKPKDILPSGDIRILYGLHANEEINLP